MGSMWYTERPGLRAVSAIHPVPLAVLIYKIGLITLLHGIVVCVCVCVFLRGI